MVFERTPRNRFTQAVGPTKPYAKAGSDRAPRLGQ